MRHLLLLIVVLVGSLVRPDPANAQTAVVDYSFGDFANAVSLSLNAAGNVFVLDAGKNEVSEFTPKGEPVKMIGGRGWGDLEFDAPTDVSANFALDLYVCDYNNRRLQRFDRRMNFVQSFTADNIVPPITGSFYPRASALSTQGELYVVESDGRRVLKFDPAQHLEREFGSFNAGAGALVNPRDIVVTPEGRVIVLDEHRIVEYDAYANYLSAIVLDSLAASSSLNRANDGLLLVEVKRVIVFSNEGLKRFVIEPQSLVGNTSQEEFRDAVIVGSVLYLLTAHTVVVARINIE